MLRNPLAPILLSLALLGASPLGAELVAGALGPDEEACPATDDPLERGECTAEMLDSLDTICEALIEEIVDLLGEEGRADRLAKHVSWRSERDALCHAAAAEHPDPLAAKDCAIGLTEVYFLELEEELVDVESAAAAERR